MKTHVVYQIDKNVLCDTGCLRMAIHGLTINDENGTLADIKLCAVCLKDQVTAEVYASR